jgi:CHASE2 domain-containing sensor protein
MKKVRTKLVVITIAVLIMVILMLCFIFFKIVQFIAPILILLGLIIVCVGALAWVIKSSFKKEND